MESDFPTRASFTFKRLADGRCEFSYEEGCDDLSLVRQTAATFGPALEVMGLQASVSEDGKTLRVAGVCDVAYAADIIVSEFLPLSNAAKASLGDIWKNMVKATTRDLRAGNGNGGDLLSDVDIERILSK